MSKPEPTFEFRPIPPPDEAPQYPEAAQYGVLSCLRVETDEDAFRCRSCGRMQEDGSPMVMVAAGIRIGDPVWHIHETSRQTTWNGQACAWCVRCARKLGTYGSDAAGSEQPAAGSEQPAEASEQPSRLASWWRGLWR